jgi:hypothetical protein
MIRFFAVMGAWLLYGQPSHLVCICGGGPMAIINCPQYIQARRVSIRL